MHKISIISPILVQSYFRNSGIIEGGERDGKRDRSWRKLTNPIPSSTQMNHHVLNLLDALMNDITQLFSPLQYTIEVIFELSLLSYYTMIVLRSMRSTPTIYALLEHLNSCRCSSND